MNGLSARSSGSRHPLSHCPRLAASRLQKDAGSISICSRCLKSRGPPLAARTLSASGVLSSPTFRHNDRGRSHSPNYKGMVPVTQHQPDAAADAAGSGSTAVRGIRDGRSFSAKDRNAIGRLAGMEWPLVALAGSGLRRRPWPVSRTSSVRAGVTGDGKAVD